MHKNINFSSNYAYKMRSFTTSFLLINYYKHTYDVVIYGVLFEFSINL